MNRIRKGDEVVVITGGDKGKRGVVATILKMIASWLKVSISAKSTLKLIQLWV